MSPKPLPKYACRVGTTSRHCFGDDEASLKNHAWYMVTAADRPNLAGQKAPNAFALYEMHGNVWEWCADLYVDEETKAYGRVIRGGGWNFPARFCRSASRNWDPETTPNGVLGFRPACSIR